MESRLAEAAKMGFHRCLAPRSSLKRLEAPDPIRVIGVRTVAEAMEALF
jgi:DNA repair protein RadA/Sms